MKKRVLKITLSNKLFYSLVTVVAILLIATGVYAVSTVAPGASGNPGHNIADVGPPTGCSDGQYLRFRSSGGNEWICATPSSPQPSTYVTVISEDSPPSTAAYYVSCPSGYSLIGGGCSCPGIGNIRISNQRSGYPNDWYCFCSSAGIITATAFCID